MYYRAGKGLVVSGFCLYLQKYVVGFFDRQIDGKEESTGAVYVRAK
jgi:hypothetical protein